MRTQYLIECYEDVDSRHMAALIPLRSLPGELAGNHLPHKLAIAERQASGEYRWVQINGIARDVLVDFLKGYPLGTWVPYNITIVKGDG